MTPFNPTTNSELTSGLPITQDIMRRLRDDGYTKLPDSGQTNETNTGRVLAPDGAGGVQWVAGSTPVTSNTGVQTAPQASATTVISGLPAGKHLLTLVSSRVDGAGAVLKGMNSVQVILNTLGTPIFTIATQLATVGASGANKVPAFNVTTYTASLGSGTGTIGNVTYTATSTGVTATWTNDTEYVLIAAIGLASN